MFSAGCMFAPSWLHRSTADDGLQIRGALVMMWQMWTAFGIMLGYVCDVAFMNVRTDAVPDLNWRLMLSSPMVPPLIVCAGVYFCVRRYIRTAGEFKTNATAA
jgi:hypothetical protein